LAAAAGTHRVS
jgi:hypothetical protein